MADRIDTTEVERLAGPDHSGTELVNALAADLLDARRQRDGALAELERLLRSTDHRPTAAASGTKAAASSVPDDGAANDPDHGNPMLGGAPDDRAHNEPGVER